MLTLKSIQMGVDSQNVQDLGIADPKKYPDGCRLSECFYKCIITLLTMVSKLEHK